LPDKPGQSPVQITILWTGGQHGDCNRWWEMGALNNKTVIYGDRARADERLLTYTSPPLPRTPRSPVTPWSPCTWPPQRLMVLSTSTWRTWTRRGGSLRDGGFAARSAPQGLDRGCTVPLAGAVSFLQAGRCHAIGAGRSGRTDLWPAATSVLVKERPSLRICPLRARQCTFRTLTRCGHAGSHGRGETPCTPRALTCLGSMR